MSPIENADALNAIGQHVADVLGKTPQNVFVYIRAGDNWQEAAIFDDLGNRVVYHDPSMEMCYEIGRLWDAADPERKWAMIHYDIKDGRFEVEYFYPDQLDPDEDSPDFRPRALAARYGDKQVVYPEPEEAWGHDLNEDDLNEE